MDGLITMQRPNGAFNFLVIAMPWDKVSIFAILWWMKAIFGQ